MTLLYNISQNQTVLVKDGTDTGWKVFAVTYPSQFNVQLFDDASTAHALQAEVNILISNVMDHVMKSFRLFNCVMGNVAEI